jgi:hypothetical protein
MTKSKRKRTPKAVLKLPDLEQSKSAVLNSLTSPSSQRSYDCDWVCMLAIGLLRNKASAFCWR